MRDGSLCSLCGWDFLILLRGCNRILGEADPGLAVPWAGGIASCTNAILCLWPTTFLLMVCLYLPLPRECEGPWAASPHHTVPRHITTISISAILNPDRSGCAIRPFFHPTPLRSSQNQYNGRRGQDGKRSAAPPLDTLWIQTSRQRQKLRGDVALLALTRWRSPPLPTRRQWQVWTRA